MLHTLKDKSKCGMTIKLKLYSIIVYANICCPLPSRDSRPFWAFSSVMKSILNKFLDTESDHILQFEW